VYRNSDILLSTWQFLFERTGIHSLIKWGFVFSILYYKNLGKNSKKEKSFKFRKLIPQIFSKIFGLKKNPKIEKKSLLITL
jgi:hypothetical protein